MEHYLQDAAELDFVEAGPLSEAYTCYMHQCTDTCWGNPVLFVSAASVICRCQSPCWDLLL